MTSDEAKRCLPGNRVEDWVINDQGTVIELRVRDETVWLTVRYDLGPVVTYQDEEVEYLDVV